MPAVPPEQRDMDAPAGARWDANSARSRQRFADAGIRLGYHNHNWELKPKDGAKTALELLFAEAEGSPLTWQADVAWLVRGGAEPEEWLRRYRDRLVSAHVKDIAPAGTKLDEDGWADVGAGVLDWRALWQTCRDCGAQLDGRRARQAVRSGTLRARELRLALEGCRAERHGTDDHRHHRLRQYQRRLPARRGTLAAGPGEVGRRHPRRSGRRRRRANMACRRCRSTRCSPIRTSRSW